MTFLSAIITLALILPTGYSVGLPQAATLAVLAMMRVISLVGTRLLYLIALLVSLIFNALGLRKAPIVSQRPPPVQLPSPANLGDASAFTLPELLHSVLFWGILLLIAGYSIYNFLQKRWGLLPRPRGGLLGRLLA